jgi:hypothetical protein
VKQSDETYRRKLEAMGIQSLPCSEASPEKRLTTDELSRRLSGK